MKHLFSILSLFMLQHSFSQNRSSISGKIVVENKGTCFFYYERKAVSQTEKQDVLQKYSFTDYPKELQKKVTLLEHFKSYLQSSTA